ncbi:MAG: hypothetical protein V1799_16495 [bacterium]
MTCDDFKEQLNRLLASESSEDLSAEMESHLAECAHCGLYKEEILRIHQDLQSIPIVVPSQQLIASIKTIEKEREELPMKLEWELERKLVIPMVLVTALMWYAQQLENSTGVIIQVIVVTCALSVGFIATLKSYFFSLSGISKTKFRQY